MLRIRSLPRKSLGFGATFRVPEGSGRFQEVPGLLGIPGLGLFILRAGCFALLWFEPWLLMRQQLRGPVSDTKPSQLATRAWKAPSSSPTSDPATEFLRPNARDSAHPVQPLPDQSMIREQVLLVMRNNFTEFGVRPSTPMLRISPVPLLLRLPQIRTHLARLS